MKAVILAGGSGTRLWPLSRKKTPKQLHKIVSSKTMLEDTIRRLNFLDKKDIFIATNKEYEAQTRKLAKGIPQNQIIIEPALRDTAPCIGLAATYIKKLYGENEVMAVIYADQYIKNEGEFKKALKLAEKIAIKEKTLNIVEVEAKFPNTNLGYVEIGKLKEEKHNIKVYEFKRFKEKPNHGTAKKFLKSKNFVWNTGIYVWQVKNILEKFSKHQNKTYEKLLTIEKSIGTKNELKTLKKEYTLCEKTSIDYGIMEKVAKKEVNIIVAKLGWNDIGTFESIHDELTESAHHNLVKGQHCEIDTEGCIIYGNNKKLIATIGLKNIAIIDTPDALLVCDKRESGQIKELLKKIPGKLL